MARRAFVLPSYGDNYTPKVKGDVELETAKTILRRAGRIVFNAEITDGRAGMGYVKIDGENYTPAEVIRRATEQQWPSAAPADARWRLTGRSSATTAG